MGVPIHSSEFQTVDGFYEPEAAGLLFSLNPMLLAFLALMGLGLLVIGWGWGGRRRDHDDPCDAIHAAIRKAVDAAVGAGRDQVVARARALEAVIQDHLGDVLALSGGIAGPLAALRKALNGDGHGAHAPGDAGGAGIGSIVINAERVTVNGQPPEPEDHGSASAHGSGEDDHHGGPPLDSKAQVAALRAAIHAFSDHWADKPRRLAELRAARRQMIRPAPLPKRAGGH